MDLEKIRFLLFLMALFVGGAAIAGHETSNPTENNTLSRSHCNLKALAQIMKKILQEFYPRSLADYTWRTLAKPVTWVLDVAKLPRHIRDGFEIKDVAQIPYKIQREGIIYSATLYLIFTDKHPIYYIHFDPKFYSDNYEEEFDEYVKEKNPENRSKISVIVNGFSGDEFLNSHSLVKLRMAEMRWKQYQRLNKNKSNEDLKLEMKEFFTEEQLYLRKYLIDAYGWSTDPFLFHTTRRRHVRLNQELGKDKVFRIDLGDEIFSLINLKITQAEKSSKLTQNAITEIYSTVDVYGLLTKKLESIAKEHGPISHLDLETHGNEKCLMMGPAEFDLSGKRPLKNVFAQNTTVHVRACLIGENKKYLKNLGFLLCDKGCKISASNSVLWGGSESEDVYLDMIDELHNTYTLEGATIEEKLYSAFGITEVNRVKIIDHIKHRKEDMKKLDSLIPHQKWIRDAIWKVKQKIRGDYATFEIPPRK